MPPITPDCFSQAGRVLGLGWLLAVLLAAAPAPVDSPAPAKTQESAASSQAVTSGSSVVLTREATVRWALQHNPELASIRQQHGIAAAGVVIARTYPFNPTLDGRLEVSSGPTSAGITNKLFQEYNLLTELELRGQGAYRRAGACATLTRTDWEIAAQEVAVALRALRAYDGILYRQEKLRLVEETIRLNEQALERVTRLLEAGQGHFRPDLIVLRTEIQDARTLVAPGRSALETVQFDLRRALGLVQGAIEVQGNLEPPPAASDAAFLTRLALQRRPEVHSHRAAVAEAEAHLRLEIANRYGNPSLGPGLEYDPSRVTSVGAIFNLPLPVLNTHRGEILQREAERARAVLELRQTEVAVQQDVQTALARLATAQSWLTTYRDETLPRLQESLESIERLFAQNEPGVDVLRVLDVRRKLLHARDGYLDALWEASQAWADLAAAVGDPCLALLPAPAQPPATSPDPAPANAQKQEAEVLSLPTINLNGRPPAGWPAADQERHPGYQP